MDEWFKSDSQSIQARNSAPHPEVDKSLSGNVTTLFVVPVLCLKNTFSPSPDGWEGGSKNRRHPSLLHMDPIYRPTWQRPVGLLAHSWIPAGEGEGCWVASHVRWDPGAATLLLDTDLVFLGPCFLLGPISGACPRSATSPYLAQPPTSILASEGPPWFLETLCLPPGSEVPRGGYGFSATSPGALSLMFTRGKGCACQKQLYKYGAGTPPESLG